MKESNLGLMAYNLLDAVTALAGILDQPIKGNCVRVNYQHAARLICNAQMTAKSAAEELSWIASGDADLPEAYPWQKGGDA